MQIFFFFSLFHFCSFLHSRFIFLTSVFLLCSNFPPYSSLLFEKAQVCPCMGGSSWGHTHTLTHTLSHTHTHILSYAFKIKSLHRYSAFCPSESGWLELCGIFFFFPIKPMIITELRTKEQLTPSSLFTE